MEPARPTLHPPRQGDRLIPTGEGKNISHVSTKTPPPSNIEHLNGSPSGLHLKHTHKHMYCTLFSPQIKQAGVEII